MGGFEGSSHRRGDGRRVDPIRRTAHDQRAAEDYSLLVKSGLSTARDALRWHLIERSGGSYDWSSCLEMLRAARSAGLQVIWDLCHYGVPDFIDIWSQDFVPRFTEFAVQAARVVRAETDGPTFYCPMNEISYWAWAGGSHGGMYPSAHGRGGELKRQLVRAGNAAVRAIRAVDPAARFIQPEPLINVVASWASRPDEKPTPGHTAQFEACDLITGRIDPDVGGSEECLDIIGANFYFDNQWFANHVPIPFGHPMYRPLSYLLAELFNRYGRPIIVSETGAEGRSGAAWLRYVAAEVRTARQAGVPVLGICIYPVMDYPGWTNSRHCRNGLIELDADWNMRRVDQDLLAQIRAEQAAGWKLSTPAA